MNLKPHVVPFSIVIILAFANYLLVKMKNNTELESAKILVFPPENIEHFSFGHRYSLGDLTWLRTVQDFEACKPVVNKAQQDKNEICSLGWLYQMLDTVTDYNPKFYIAYALGGVSLMILVRDLEGAYRLLLKGVENFPTDWVLRYRLGSHCILFLNRKEEAAEHFRVAAENGAPDWLYATSTRLLVESGKKEFGQRFLEELKQSGVRQHILDRVQMHLNNSM